MNSFPISTYHYIRLCATSWVTRKREMNLSFSMIAYRILPNTLVPRDREIKVLKQFNEMADLEGNAGRKENPDM